MEEQEAGEWRRERVDDGKDNGDGVEHRLEDMFKRAAAAVEKADEKEGSSIVKQ